MSLKEVIQEWKGVPVHELLREMYCEKQYPISKIAEELHISVGIVHKWLCEYGITRSVLR